MHCSEQAESITRSEVDGSRDKHSASDLSGLLAEVKPDTVNMREEQMWRRRTSWGPDRDWCPRSWSP
ncbi:hypothetical protein RRG08_052066 [Elysia crispata]|uniref:Uncharacterized protein n=1 Tax=Elysia crispata TaxID=231223 RepID=A0AAE1A4G4_9GAST|nr:hypothetical protein RRG08_052066 [Elysia crispata]